MTDRELLELAAKAAGVDPKTIPDHIEWDTGRCIQRGWNPLTDDGDALRLAVKLKLRIDIIPWGTDAYPWNDYNTDFVDCIRGDDPYAATRRAIVRAAAEIGKEVK